MYSELKGVLRGGGRHGVIAPPLVRQGSIICVELYAKVRHATPPFVTWAESLSTQTDRIWVKTFILCQKPD